MQIPYIDNGFLLSVIKLAAGLTLTFIVAHYLNKFLISKLVLPHPELMTTLSILRRVVVLSVALIGAMATVTTVFPQAIGMITSLFVAAGFASIVVGLAAQSSLSNVVAGILISISQPFRIGDAVMFRDEYCYVEDMRLVHTVLRTWDNRRLVIPNSVLQSEVLTNYSIVDPSVLVPVYVQVSYDSDLKKANGYNGGRGEETSRLPPNRLTPECSSHGVRGLGHQPQIANQGKRSVHSIRYDTRPCFSKIKKEFDRNGIVIPYPVRYLTFGPEVREIISDLRRAD
jgi:Small-conductance mechanosensitive channel